MEEQEKTTKLFPKRVELEKGKTYLYCKCEYSKVKFSLFYSRINHFVMKLVKKKI